MFCRFCGAQLADSARFCNKCGSPLAQAESTEPVVEEVAVAVEEPAVMQEPVAAEEVVPVAVAVEEPVPVAVAAEEPVPVEIPVSTVVPPVYVPPVYVAPTVPENPFVQKLKRHHTSGLFIAAIVAYTAMVVCQLAGVFSTSATLNTLAGLMPSNVISSIVSTSTLFALLGMLPVLFTVIGLWVFFANSRQPANRSTTGLTLIKTSAVLRLIWRILVLALVVILCVVMMSVVGAALNALSDDLGSSMDEFGSSMDSFGSSMDGFASAAPMASFSYYDESGSHQVYIEDYDQYMEGFEQYEDELNDLSEAGEMLDSLEGLLGTAVDMGVGLFNTVLVILIVVTVIALGVPIAHDFCILSSLKSLRLTLQKGTYSPRALGAVQVFNWIMAVSAFSSFTGLLSASNTLQRLGNTLSGLGVMAGEALPFDMSIFAPNMWTILASALQVAVYVLFALSISQYKKAQRAA